MDHKDLCEHTKIRLIAAALGHQQCTKTEAFAIPLPGTNQCIAVGTADQVRALLPAQALPGIDLDRDTIRDIFMAHGFTIKEGQTDLKPYVYEAAEALIAQARAAQPTLKLSETYAHLLSVQRAEAETGDPYMAGLYNGMAMMCANVDGDLNWQPLAEQAAVPVVATEPEISPDADSVSPAGQQALINALRAAANYEIPLELADIIDAALAAVPIAGQQAAPVVATSGYVLISKHRLDCTRAVLKDGNYLTALDELDDDVRAAASQAAPAEQWQLPKQWRQHVARAYVEWRKHDHTTPDDILDLMRDILYAAEKSATLPAPAQQAGAAASDWAAKLEGKLVSMDVSTGDADAYHRIFCRVTEVMLKASGADEDTILVIEESRNFGADGPLPNEPKPCKQCDPSVGFVCEEHGDATAATTSDAARDVARLDFMAEHEAWIAWSKDSDSCRVFVRNEDGDTQPLMGWIPEAWGRTSREAIDSAMRATQQEGEANDRA